MASRAKVAEMIGQTLLREVEQYEKETGRRASKIVIQLGDDWPRGDSSANDVGTYTGSQHFRFGFSVEVESGPVSP